MIYYENMSAVHAGTKKWNKIINSHSERHAQTKTTSNANLVKVFSFSVNCAFSFFIVQ